MKRLTALLLVLGLLLSGTAALAEDPDSFDTEEQDLSYTEQQDSFDDEEPVITAERELSSPKLVANRRGLKIGEIVGRRDLKVGGSIDTETTEAEYLKRRTIV